MPWFKVDDQLHDHRKAARAGVAAMGLWTMAGSWSADNLTDGFIPEDVPVRWDRQWKRLAQRLVDAGLWHPAEKDGERGWVYHEWDERQPTREEVEADRAEARDRMALLRAKRKAERRAELEQEIAAAEAAGVVVKRKGSKRVRPNVRANSPGTFERSSENVLGPNPTRPDPSRPDHLSEPPAGADVADAPPPTTTQTLVAEWIALCGQRPPGEVVGGVSKRIKAMLDEGIPVTDVRAGLEAWHHKGLHFSTLPSVVHETRTARTRRPASTAASTTDQRVEAVLALRDELRADTSHQPPAIGA